MKDRIDVPKELSSCVKSIGGVLLDDNHGPDDPRKADYWFPEAQVVAELKLLSEDFFDDSSYVQWLTERYHDWVRRGLARPVRGRQVVNLRNLPPECAHEVTSYLRRKLDSSLSWANKQIKSSREELVAPSALGLLILVNDGNPALPPGMVRNIISRSLPHKFSAINSVIHFSVNIRSDSPLMDKDCLFWCEFSVQAVRPTVPQALMDKLRGAWFSHHEKLLGESIPQVDAGPDALYDLKLIR